MIPKILAKIVGLAAQDDSFAALRAILLIESPAPFRSRNLFVSENALSRA